MSLYNYFSKFGTISYNDSIVNNIISSVRFRDAVRSKVNVFYPYTIKEGERPESIASFYYDDERYYWVVMLSNNIIDPYYQWPLTLNDFNKFIIKKYQSKEIAVNKILFFRNNWYKDDSIITPGAYNALPANLRKYWNPMTGYNGQIGSYERKKIDDTLETNKIIKLAVSSTTGFFLEERITQRTSGTLSASGTIKSIDNTSLTVNNIQGDFAVSGGAVGSIVGDQSQSSRTVSSISTVYQPIPATEIPYWEPISAFDYENELNESRKNIKLIDKQYLNVIEDQMLELLS